MSKNKNQESMGEVFVISVAAELAGMHAQTLRTYDRMGLVTPQRTSGGGRRYSREDVELLRTVHVPRSTAVVMWESRRGPRRKKQS